MFLKQDMKTTRHKYLFVHAGRSSPADLRKSVASQVVSQIRNKRVTLNSFLEWR
jgi:hypothetical protein